MAVLKPAHVRAGYSMWQKSKVIEKYFELESQSEPRVQFPHQETCKWAFGKNWEDKKGYLTKWLRKCDVIRELTSRGGRAAALMRDPTSMDRNVKFSDQEDELYIRFLFRRTALGYPCNAYWLRLEMDRILAEAPPPGFDPNRRMSTGWAVRFCYRYNITTQAQNNCKAHDQADRAKAIKKFHRFLNCDLQASEPQRDPKYGRFGPRRMFHVDQVPLPFASTCRTTLNPRGAKSCRIAGTNTSGLEKRQATLQLWICADGGRCVIKPTIIFRGSDASARSILPKAEEKALYDTLTGIRIYFQPKAWADGLFCEREIIHVAADLRAAGIFDEVMFGMDNHGAQRTPMMMELYESLQMTAVFTAANCTDCISPVDHHVGRFIQNHMGRAYQQAIEDDPHIWRAESADQELEDVNGSNAMHRRMLMAQWLDAAWIDLTTNHQSLIEKAFVHTGFLLARDGSEDHLMNIQGWQEPPHPVYGFR